MSLVLYDFATSFKDYTGDYAYENPGLYKEFIRKLSRHENYKWLPSFFGGISESPILIGIYDTMFEEWYELDYLNDYSDDEEYSNLYDYINNDLEWDEEQKINAEEILCSTEESYCVGAI